MITSRGGTGKARPGAQHRDSAGSCWPSGGTNTGFSAEDLEVSQHGIVAGVAGRPPVQRKVSEANFLLGDPKSVYP